MINFSAQGRLVLAGASILFVSLPTQSALVDQGGGLIYDDVLDVTWLQDAGIGGSLNWADASAWAANLTFGGSSDWRLASMDVNGIGGAVDCSTSSELDCRDNELGYMFHQNGVTHTSPGPFTGLASSNYWSSTPLNSSSSRLLSFFDGSQSFASNTSAWRVWAVADGNVVPLPAAAWLFGSALIGLSAFRRRKG